MLLGLPMPFLAVDRSDHCAYHYNTVLALLVSVQY